ncbi:10711_t:CDS:2, partial [Scutellospora calospora]
RLHKEKRAQRNKTTTSPNPSFSTNNPYINETTETVTDNNEPLTTETNTTTTCSQELPHIEKVNTDQDVVLMETNENN